MKRLRTAKGRKVSSTRWLERQLNDPYVKRARAENYRSRAAYKLLELDERFELLKGVKAVVDLGIAPGGGEVVRHQAPHAMSSGSIFCRRIRSTCGDPQMDFMDEAALDHLRMHGRTRRPRPVRHGREPSAVGRSTFANDGFSRGWSCPRGAPTGRRLCREGACGRQPAGRRTKAQLHEREARQATGQRKIRANASSRRASRASGQGS